MEYMPLRAHNLLTAIMLPAPRVLLTTIPTFNESHSHPVN